MAGRKSTYSRAAADVVCAGLAAGMSLRAAAAAAGVPHTTVSEWVMRDEDGIAERYARARALRINELENQIGELGDQCIAAALAGGEGVNAVVQAYRVKIDSIKWELSKLRPHVYGDRIAQELSGPNGGGIQHTITVEAIAAPERKLLEPVERED